MHRLREGGHVATRMGGVVAIVDTIRETPLLAICHRCSPARKEGALVATLALCMAVQRNTTTSMVARRCSHASYSLGKNAAAAVGQAQPNASLVWFARFSPTCTVSASTTCACDSFMNSVATMVGGPIASLLGRVTCTPPATGSVDPHQGKPFGWSAPPVKVAT